MPDRKPEWALNLSTELKKWVPEHGYQPAVKLADELDIPRGPFGHIYQGNAIMSGEQRGKEKLDGRIYYARLHLWTELTEADPRNIPDRLYTTRGEITAKSRKWSEERYQQWSKSPEAQEILDKKNLRFNRGIIVQPKGEPVSEPAATPAPVELHKEPETPTVGSFIGSFVDGLVNKMTQQIASQLLENQRDMVLPQISELENRTARLEGAIEKLVHSRADRIPTAQPRISRGSNDIGQLATHLTNLLDGYRTGTSDDRDKLMQVYGTDLMALDVLVHTLTRRQNEREERLRLQEDTKL